MEPYGGSELPTDLQVGEIRALRTFRLGPDGALYPLFSDAPWLDGSNEARCRVAHRFGTDQPVHAAPADDCTCGFYAYGFEHGAEDYPQARHVLAVVACWGSVVAGTRGVRAQYCRVEALWFSPAVPDDLVAAADVRYDAAVVYRDKAVMLKAHPPTRLDCYEPVRPRTIRQRLLYSVLAVAVVASAVPLSWWGIDGDGRSLSAGAFAIFLVVAFLAGRGRRTDAVAIRRRIVLQSVALWMLAPFAGTTGALVLRVPLLLLAGLLLLQRFVLRRQASRFPAQIGHA